MFPIFENEIIDLNELDEAFAYYIAESGIQRRNRIINPGPTEQAIIRAIQNRYYVGIYYADPANKKSVKPGFRLIEPYCYGSGYRHLKSGEILYPERQYLRAYVILTTAKENLTIRRKSVSKSMNPNWWRLFRVDRIQNWFAFRIKYFHYREGYNPQDKMMGRIITSLPHKEFPKGVRKIN
jgi:hypothetical protein